jgi:hypothetical protein
MPLPAGYAIDAAAPAAAPAAVKLPAGYTLDASEKPDLFDRAVNYHTGNALIDAPLGLVQGAAKGAMSTIQKGGEAVEKLVPGVKAADEAYDRLTGTKPPSPALVQHATEAEGIGQGTGKFLEQAAEFAVPAADAAKAVKGAGLLARTAAQAGVGAGVSAVQSGGDPAATAIGAGLGGAGEVAGAVASGAKKLLAAKAPTLANFAESFGGATPTQKARITAALPTLERDGIVPADSIHEMQDAVKGKLGDLSKAYDALDPAVKAREAVPDAVVTQLRKAQQQYTRRGVVTNDTAYNAIEDQIQKVQDIAKANNGKLNVDDIVHLKQNANGRTNFQSPDAEKNIWRGIGDAYRKAADTLAPETKPLNQDYQKYKDLEQIADQNVARGKGTTPSVTDQIVTRVAQHGTGAAAGATLGHAVAGAPGGVVGGILGGIVGPKLGKMTLTAIQNAEDSGAFAALSPARQAFVKAAAKAGDNSAILKILGQAATNEAAVSSQ